MSTVTATPNIQARAFVLSADGTPTRVNAIGTFVFVDTADAGFELSFDGTHYIPMREGRVIQTASAFGTLFLRAESAVHGWLVFGDGSVNHFASYGGGGGITSGSAAPLAPYDSYSALGNAVTASLPTGVYAILFEGQPPSARTWQLRAWTDAAAPVTDTVGGLVVPVDYGPANARVWFRS